MNLRDQQLLFQYFTDTYDATITAAKSRGQYDVGITSIHAKRILLKEKEAIHTEEQSGRIS